MDVEYDEAKYARMQRLYLLEVAGAIRDALSKNGVRQSELRKLTEEVTLTTSLAIEGDLFDDTVLPITPYVCFGGMGLGTEGALMGNGNGYLSEIAYDVVEELFQNE